MVLGRGRLLQEWRIYIHLAEIKREEQREVGISQEEWLAH